MTDTPPPTPEVLRELLKEILEDLPELIRSLRGRLRDDDQFDEVVQNVRVTLLERFDPHRFFSGPDVRDSLRAFVFKIARDSIADHYRKRQRGLQAVEEDIIADAARDNLSPSRLMAKDQAEATLQECLSKLGRDDRQLMEKRYFESMPMKQIADEFGLTEDALGNRLRRIKKELRNLLGSSGSIRFDINPR